MSVRNWINDRIKIKCWKIWVLCFDKHNIWSVVPENMEKLNRVLTCCRTTAVVLVLLIRKTLLCKLSYFFTNHDLLQNENYKSSKSKKNNKFYHISLTGLQYFSLYFSSPRATFTVDITSKTQNCHKRSLKHVLKQRKRLVNNEHAAVIQKNLTATILQRLPRQVHKFGKVVV